MNPKRRQIRLTYVATGESVLAEPLPLKPGEARPPEKPGLGVELDEEKVERYRVRAD